MKRTLLTALALVFLCGCSPNAREPDDLALVRVLGVDGVSPVTLTAVCGSSNGQEPVRGSCTKESFDLARSRLPWTEGREELALTSVGYLLVGGDADLAAILFAVLEDQELGASATVWLVETEAAVVLKECKDPVAQMELLDRQGVEAPTVAKTLGTLLTDGSVLLPVVALRDGQLMLQGEARWDEQ